MRNNPFFSPVGIITTLLLLCGLGMTIWRSGGKAFSPGDLSAMEKPGVTPGGYRSHAEFESECRLCHLPLETTQDTLCLACHTQVADQIPTNAGTHGRIRQVNRCAACHQEHLGTDYDPTRSAYPHFDHSGTHFSLAWHQVGYDTLPIDCLACHTEAPSFSVSLEGCVDCHRNQDFAFIQKHSADFGLDCLGCHDGRDVMTGFDHQATAFPLDGRHARIACRLCHTQVRTASQGAVEAENILQVFRQIAGDCAGCHQEPRVHAGVFPQPCGTCHTTQAWSPATLESGPFDHFAQAGFSLALHRSDYRSQVINCRECHPTDLKLFGVEACTACHEQGEATPGFLREHQTQYGPACLECHDGSDRMRGFRHDDHFPLQGKHTEIACQDCHTAGSYTGTPTECVSCHAEPAIHAGFFGLKCQYCHGADSWSPAQLQVHKFPVQHGDQDGSDCKACHQDRYDVYTCYTCHEHQPEPILESHLKAGVTAQALPACMDCHPAGRVEERP